MFPPNAKVAELGGDLVHPQYRPNLNCVPGPAVDIICDLADGIPLETEGYDGIFAQFILEHIRHARIRRFISELHRVLKPGGRAILITANLYEQAKRLVETEEWTDDEVYMVFGGNPDYCIPTGTIVWTDRGGIPIEAVEVGDKVLGLRGRFERVRAKFERHIDEDILALKTVGAGEIRLTKNHQIPFIASQDKMKTKPRVRVKAASSLHVGDILVMPKHRSLYPDYPYRLDKTEGLRTVVPSLRTTKHPSISINKSYIKTHGHETPRYWDINEDFARFIGYYLSEGSVFLRRKTGAITLTNTDKTIAEDMSKAMRAVFSVVSERLKPMKPPYRDAYEATHYGLVDSLALVHYFGKKDHERHLPWSLLHVPKSFTIECLRSLFLGDGSIQKIRNTYVLNLGSTSFWLLMQVKLMLSRLNIFAILYRHNIKNRKPQWHQYWNLRIHGESARQFLTLTGLIKEPSAPMIFRKPKIYDWPNFFGVEIKAVEPEPYEGKVYDLTAAGSFVVASGIAVKNSGNYHHSGFSPRFAWQLFKEAGFYEVKIGPLEQCQTDMVIVADKSGAKVEVSH